MNSKIIISEEQEAKLKKLRIKTKVLNYIKKDYQNQTDFTNFTWHAFICVAFAWATTKEGYDYWRAISRQ